MPDNFEEYNKIVDETWNKVHYLSRLKGGEYAGDKDRLANFRRNAEALGLEMETVWAVYAAKHWDAVMQYVKDCAKKTNRIRSEPIEGRVDDLIVYLLLFKLIIRDQSVNVPELSFPKPPPEDVGTSGYIHPFQGRLYGGTLRSEQYSIPVKGFQNE